MPERRECFVKDPRTTITARKGESQREILSTLSPLHDLFLARFHVARWEKSYAPVCFLLSGHWLFIVTFLLRGPVLKHNFYSRFLSFSVICNSLSPFMCGVHEFVSVVVLVSLSCILKERKQKRSSPALFLFVRVCFCSLIAMLSYLGQLSECSCTLRNIHCGSIGSGPSDLWCDSLTTISLP